MWIWTRLARLLGLPANKFSVTFGFGNCCQKLLQKLILNLPLRQNTMHNF